MKKRKKSRKGNIQKGNSAQNAGLAWLSIVIGFHVENADILNPKTVLQSNNTPSAGLIKCR